MHELRHSAADNLWRETGNLLLAQQLLRHESVATTQDYLHPSRGDLAHALTPSGSPEIRFAERSRYVTRTHDNRWTSALRGGKRAST
jgi:integrase